MSNKAKYKVVLMRGISGSGKSTYIKNHFPDAVVCSADHYFIDNQGKYNFDRNKLGAAHGSCKANFAKALKERKPLIVVDNTNTKLSEMKPYVDMAKHHGYRIEVVRLDTPPHVAADRNVHGVPPEAIDAMHRRMADIPPEWNETVVKGTSEDR